MYEQQTASIGGTLRHKRLDQGWRLEDLGARAGISYPYLSKIERDQVIPSAEALKRISCELGLDIKDQEGLLQERDVHVWAKELGVDSETSRIMLQISRLDPESRIAILHLVETCPVLEPEGRRELLAGFSEHADAR